MFDKLIESNSEGADFKKRRSYFMVSSVVVGILFLSAVIVSIYAQEFVLDTDDWEMTRLLAPVAMPDQAPEPPRPAASAPAASERSAITQRRENMMRPDEQPTAVPTTTSVVPNSVRSRPPGDFIISGKDVDALSPVSSGRESLGAATSDGQGLGGDRTVAEVRDIPEPPPVKRAEPVQKTAPKSLGVVNGIATDLPKPAYSPAAKAAGISGDVKVQVTIDESGKVISAKAVDGPSLLRNDAERAALRARFTPTKLSHVPVKVTGVIVYRFNRN